MQKTITYLSMILGLLCHHITDAQVLNYSVPLNVCLGGTTGSCNAVVTSTATGATSYSWTAVSGVSTAFITQLTGVTGTDVAISFSNCGTYTIQCVPFNGASAIPGSAVSKTINVSCLPSPTVVITAPPTSVCYGAIFSMSVTGAMSYTWSQFAYVGSSLTMSLSSNSCINVFGMNSVGCISGAVSCVTVIPVPIVQASPFTTVCVGSSVTLSVTGASSYTWVNGATTSTINVTPSLSTCYNVKGTAVTGCTANANTCVIPSNTCSNVWPGDANSDGIVDNTDVLELGLAFGSNGPARAIASNAYLSQFASNWTGTISTGKNKCHADCNGDGIVNNSDTLAIFNNYALTHAFKPTNESTVNDIDIVMNPAIASVGSWNKADIIAGTTAASLSQLYGLAYDINFDQNVIQQDSVYLVYTSSFFNASGQNINFRKRFFINGKLVTASVRTNGSNVSGNGKIGELWFKVKSGLQNNTVLNLSISNAKKMDKTGILSPLTGGSKVVSVSNGTVIATSLGKNGATGSAISLFPNPASNQLVLQSDAKGEISFSILDITGRKIMNGNFASSTTLDLSEYAAGSYLVRFDLSSGTQYKKLLIDK